MSFYTSLTGLNDAQTELSTIANNIANAATNGFKKSRVDFGDIISASPLQDPKRVVGSGVAVRQVAQQFQQGAIATSDSALDLAISGQGFFTVKSPGGDNQVAYTRNGAFTVLADRYVVDGDGRRLQVYPTTADGSVLTTALGSTRSLQLPLTSGIPKATTAIKLSVNLSASSPVITAPFDPRDTATYNSATSLTVFDTAGNPLSASVYYAKTAVPSGADPLHHWTAHVIVDGAELTSGGTAGFDMGFDASGTLVSPATPTAFDSFVPPGGGGALTLAVDHGVATTQQSGPFAVNVRTQDGFATGRLESVAVDGDGTVRSSFTNGDIQILGQVAVALFSNPQGLKQLGNATYLTSPEAGPALMGVASLDGLGAVKSGSIEKSNVDLTEELVGLITAQRNYQANAKAIETGSTLLNTIIQIN